MGRVEVRIPVDAATAAALRGDKVRLEAAGRLMALLETEVAAHKAERGR